jgi:[acyl-carrier-protein] S-malonyltransferase
MMSTSTHTTMSTRFAEDMRHAAPDSARPGPRIALLLPGQGAQYPGMAAGLYDREPAFTAAMDEFFPLLGRRGSAIRGHWLAEPPDERIHDTGIAQPLLFAIDYALALTARSWGLHPIALLGHSAGEYAAAVLAGVMGFAEATALLLDRLAVLEHAPAGGMYAVAADPDQVEPYLRAAGAGLDPADRAVVGAVNGPRQILVCGPQAALAGVVAELDRAGFTCRAVKASHGFHSPSLEAACARAVPLFASIGLRAPRTTLVSGYTAGVLSGSEAEDPGFWALQPARPVLFGPALDALLSQDPDILVEAGPGQGLSALARRHPRVAGGRVAVVSLQGRRPGPRVADRAALAAAVGQLLRALPEHSGLIRAQRALDGTA